METSQLLFALLIALMILNVIATVRVCMSSLFEARQKYMQFAVIWLIPVLGAGVALAIAGQPDIPVKRRQGGGTAPGDHGTFGDEGHYVGHHGHSGGDHG